MIFVQIAAYRDPELALTIRDCLTQAKFPRDLSFGICWQKAPEDRSLAGFKRTKKFRVDELPWNESLGLGWARSRIQSLYDGEAFTLQLDSHHRFAEHWDEWLMKAIDMTGSSKPILTSYAGVYNPQTDTKEGDQPFKMVADRFTPHGTILFRPHRIPRWKNMSSPIRARFVSGHFFFTIGQHCQEYKYDPQIYFAGDEISLSIRSYTLGYDLFHPHRTVVWHEYTREGRPKHWDDHSKKNLDQIETLWHERDAISKRRLRKLLKEEDSDDDLGTFGLGSVRTHRDYELYAGIDFRGRRLHREALEGKDPPCSYIDENQWEASFKRAYALTLRWKVDAIRQCEDNQFIYFGIESKSGSVLYRYDAPPESPETQWLTDQKRVEIQASEEPAKLVVWPYSRSRGWLRRVEYPL